MSIVSWPGLEVSRDAKVITARFSRPHRVVSTSPVGGGMRDDVTACYNQQLCEPAGNQTDGEALTAAEPHLHRGICAARGLDPDSTVALSTAVNMNCLGVATRSYRDLTVAAVCTAGIGGNAGRAGDHAAYYEWEGSHHLVEDDPQPRVGTIVTMLFYNYELTPGALTRSLVTATEAKTALLQDLVVGSKFSVGRATGTGTDQCVAACPTGDPSPLRFCGHHCTAGELTAQVTYEAIHDALVLQNNLEFFSQRSVCAQLGRFGVTREAFLATATRLLGPGRADLLAANFGAIDADPQLVAATAGLAEIADQLRVGVLPASCASDYAERFGALIAVAASADVMGFDEARRELRDRPFDVVDLVTTAFCVGFARKWVDLDDAVAHFRAISRA